MDRIGLIGLIKIELPSATIRLTDGGFMIWGAETFSSSDPTYGVLSSIESITEGISEEVPALKLVMLPPGTTAVATLSQPGDQQSRVRVWLGEYDPDLGTLIGTPGLLFDGQIDRTTLTVAQSQRQLEVEVVSAAERLFERNNGSPLSPAFHKSLFASETGEDQATGVVRRVAWGTEAPADTFYNTGGSVMNSNNGRLMRA